MIKEAIAKVVDKKNLGKEEAKEIFEEIMSGNASEAQIASLITALRMKGETIDEIQGAAEIMRSKVTKVNYSGNENVLDVVGTGGDGKNTFNVSTAAAIVAAGAGCIVAKHGNRSASSKSGAADVLEKLGVKIDTTPEMNSEILSKIGLTFMFAPMHHPAMKYAGKPRKEIGIRTIFNILGPITNPAAANTYLLGVYNEELAEKLAGVLAGLNTKKAMVVCGSGYDEATLTGETVVFEVTMGNVERKTFSPESLGFKKQNGKEFEVNSPEESAKIVKGILEGNEKGVKADLVKLNAGLAIYVNGKAGNVKDGIKLAEESINSGNALKKLDELIEETNK